MRMRSVESYLQQQYENIIPEFRFQARNRNEWEKWRIGLRDALVHDLGGFPERKGSLKTAVMEKREYEDYWMQKITYQMDDLLPVPSYVLIPKEKSRKMPAVLACHGHGRGCNEMLGLNPDGTDNTGDPGYQKKFPVELVKRGFLVIAPEFLGFGERRLKADKEKRADNSCYNISTNLLMMGGTMAASRIYDAICAVDYLESCDDVDIKRIGCMGISGGGLVAGFASALDDRIRATVVSGYTNTFKNSIMSVYHCVDNFIPGVLKHAELPDILGLIAPKPLLIESGTEDPIFPIKVTRESYEQIGKVYRLLESEDKLDHDFFKGVHEISGAKSYDFFGKWL